MQIKKTLTMAAMLIALMAGAADAGKGGKNATGGGSGGVPTNYGCRTFAAQSAFMSPDGLSTKRLLMSTYACYVCNTSTRVCTVQSPSTLVGYTFVY